MARYRYRAVTGDGDVIEGTTEARSQAEVVEMMLAAGNVPLRAEIDRGGAIRALLTRDLFGGPRAMRRDLPVLIRQLATLLQAGIPMERSLTILVSLAGRESTAALLNNVLEKIQGGAALSDALNAFPAVFPRFVVTMVHAGEATGNLESVLDRLADVLEQQTQLREEIRSAMRYPMIVVFACVASLAIMLVFVLPQFETMFANAGAELPWATRVVLGTTRTLRQFGWLIGLGVIGLWFAGYALVRRPAGRRLWDALCLRLPVIGGLVTQIEIGRWARTLGTLLQNGVTLTSALSIAREIVNNVALRTALSAMGESVSEGKGLATEFSQSPVIPPIATHLVRVGEETAQLDNMLLMAARICEREVAKTIERSLALFAPLLTIFVGLLVAGVIGSVLVAVLGMYELAL